MNKPVLAAMGIALAAVLSSAPAARAQCFGPDNLNGGCCQPVNLNVPAFPGAVMPGSGVCWQHCTPTQQQQIRVQWTTPVQAPCGEYSAGIDVIDGISGLTLMSGKMVLDYTRTWQEADISGAPVQVWRFAAKADLQAIPGGTALVCPTPNCIAPFGPHPTAFFYGYVDYAQRCGQLQFQNTAVLFHACDFFIHKPGLSSRPGVFHPDTAFAIIGHPPGQSFLPMNFPAPGGPLIAEAWRNVPVAGGPCIAEDKVSGGVMAPFGNACLCNQLSLVPPQVTVRLFQGKGSCVDAVGQSNNWQSQAIAFPTLPWVHMVTHSLGCWNSPQIYPGQECAMVDEGLFRDHDLCQSNDYFEVFYGGSTIKGWPVLSSTGALLSQNFTDIADNYSTPITGGALPLFGNVLPTQHLIYVNVP